MASTDIFEHFDELEDPRIDRQKRHLLMDTEGFVLKANIHSAKL